MGCMKQKGVSLKYIMEFGSRPSEKNLLLSAQFWHNELPIRIPRRAIERFVGDNGPINVFIVSKALYA
ncbi:hypothetical protein MLD38_038751 [Melastoma candidum]|uniref:Uncharacterized protein n=1 Tax=Melastoma candidum TaxID=119954 RepID=A0ACB9L0K0_9MYRT|nr:hypothetical protein MLD38_038751 [Melastoma candidum]